MTSALLISIGNELLSGQTVNTNANFLAKEMTQIGFSILKVITVPDLKEIVAFEIKNALEQGIYKVILITGGLGPTWDDSTAEFLAEALGVSTSLNTQALSIVRRRYKELLDQGLVETAKINSSREKMAFLPEGTIPLDNPVGTAPGIIYTDPVHNTLLYCLPGVPREMKAMFELLLPHLQKVSISQESHHYETELITSFTDESLLAPFLAKVRNKFNVWIKSLPGSYQEEKNIKVVISTQGKTLEEAKSLVMNAQNFLFELIKERKDPFST
jgi:molybdenum cofactor synthesis domain-containing protein